MSLMSVLKCILTVGVAFAFFGATKGDRKLYCHHPAIVNSNKPIHPDNIVYKEGGCYTAAGVNSLCTSNETDTAEITRILDEIVRNKYPKCQMGEGEMTIPASVGLLVTRVYGVSIHKKEMKVDFDMRLNWKDPHLEYNLDGLVEFVKMPGELRKYIRTPPIRFKKTKSLTDFSRAKGEFYWYPTGEIIYITHWSQTLDCPTMSSFPEPENPVICSLVVSSITSGDKYSWHAESVLMQRLKSQVTVRDIRPFIIIKYNYKLSYTFVEKNMSELGGKVVSNLKLRFLLGSPFMSSFPFVTLYFFSTFFVALSFAVLFKPQYFTYNCRCWISVACAYCCIIAMFLCALIVSLSSKLSRTLDNESTLFFMWCMMFCITTYWPIYVDLREEEQQKEDESKGKLKKPNRKIMKRKRMRNLCGKVFILISAILAFVSYVSRTLSVVKEQDQPHWTDL